MRKLFKFAIPLSITAAQMMNAHTAIHDGVMELKAGGSISPARVQQDMVSMLSSQPGTRQ